MINLPSKAEVHCSDGVAGRSTYIVVNPINHQLTHLVVKSDRLPFHEVIVPVDQVEETTTDLIRLKCTRNDLDQMEPFEFEEFIPTKVPDFESWPDAYLTWPYVLPSPGIVTQKTVTNIPVKHQNIAHGEVAVRRGAGVEATDGYVGLVDELLVNPNNMQVTHLVLLERHILKKREVTIPVSQIDRIDDDTIYLKLDRQSVEQLPTTPIQRWPLNKKDSRLKRRIMMDKMIVVVFDSEIKAYEGSKALQELQYEGSINLYAKAVIARDAGGKVTVKEQGDMGPVGTAVGLLTGSLVGLIGGPIGVAIGAGVGMSGGALYDMMHLGIGEDFLYEVEKSLLPGKAAVVAEVWEEWTLPVDTRMEAMGGVVFRRTSMEVVDEQIERDVHALNTDLDALEAEYNQATGEAKANLQKKIDAAKARLQATQDAIQARIEASQKETDAKIKSLQEQADKAHGERKAKREARIAELKADQKRRSDLLKQAWELTKQALSA
jgi:uncharacterized membrane protein/sporulation protein YlmC with PRC-barrel domain